MKSPCVVSLVLVLLAGWAPVEAQNSGDDPLMLLCSDCVRGAEVAFPVPGWFYQDAAKPDGIVWWKALAPRLEWTRLPGGRSTPSVPGGRDCAAIGRNLNRANRMALEADNVVEVLLESRAVVLVDTRGSHEYRRASAPGYRRAVQRWRTGRREAGDAARALLAAWIDNSCGT